MAAGSTTPLLPNSWRVLNRPGVSGLAGALQTRCARSSESVAAISATTGRLFCMGFTIRPHDLRVAPVGGYRATAAASDHHVEQSAFLNVRTERRLRARIDADVGAHHRAQTSRSERSESRSRLSLIKKIFGRDQLAGGVTSDATRSVPQCDRRRRHPAAGAAHRAPSPSPEPMPPRRTHPPLLPPFHGRDLAAPPLNTAR